MELMSCIHALCFQGCASICLTCMHCAFNDNCLFSDFNFLGQVCRVQGLVDQLDSLKARNVNPFSDRSNAVSITTNWETFKSGVGSLNAPPPVSSSTEVTCDWEQFD